MTRTQAVSRKEAPVSASEVRAMLSQTGRSKAVRRLTKGQSIFQAGEPAHALFFIQQGKIKVSAVSEQGKEAILILPGDGDFIGEEALIPTHTSYVTTATAITDCVLVPIEADELHRLLRENPPFSEVFLSFLLSRNRQLRESLADQLFELSERRLAKILLSLAGFEHGEATYAAVPKITHQTLAEMVGTTRPRISFFISRFRKLKLIDFKNRELYVTRALRDYVLL